MRAEATVAITPQHVHEKPRRCVPHAHTVRSVDYFSVKLGKNDVSTEKKKYINKAYLPLGKKNPKNLGERVFNLL